MNTIQDIINEAFDFEDERLEMEAYEYENYERGQDALNGDY